MTGRRVVVTGLGCVSPLGSGAAHNWERLVAGDSGIGPLTRFDPRGVDVRIAGEVQPLPRVPEDETEAHVEIHARFSLTAGREAWADAGLDGAADPDRVGVFLGSGKGITDFFGVIPALKAGHGPGGFDTPAYLDELRRNYDRSRRIAESYHWSSTYLARAIDARGPNWVCITACAAGNHAVGEASAAIRHGDADVILAGGTHSQIDLMSVTGYATLGALSERNDDPAGASRPFDRRRDGFVLGEGGTLLVLEELDHAKRRGAVIRGEVGGYGNTGDCYRVTDPHPEGIGAEAAMRAALESAGLAPGDIGYINAHGTSTLGNDAMETAAIKRIFGPKGEAPPVSSTKSMVGHLIAAAGALESLVCLRALEEGVLPPTINYEYPDADCDLDYVPNEAREARIGYAMNNSFGFGGQNVVTIFKKFDE